MRQLTKIKHMSLRFKVSLESDIDSFKFTLLDKKDGTRTEFEDAIFNNALMDAHRHFIATMKEDSRIGRAAKKKLTHHPIYR